MVDGLTIRTRIATQIGAGFQDWTVSEPESESKKLEPGISAAHLSCYLKENQHFWKYFSYLRIAVTDLLRIDAKDLQNLRKYKICCVANLRRSNLWILLVYLKISLFRLLNSRSNTQLLYQTPFYFKIQRIKFNPCMFFKISPPLFFGKYAFQKC